MLKDYLTEHKKSIYRIAKECDVPYSTLNDFVNGKVRPSECKAGMIRDVAVALGMSMDRLYDIAESDTRPMLVKTSAGIPVSISIRSKAYQIDFMYGGKPVSLELCKVCDGSRYHIDELARSRAEEYIHRSK